MTRVEKPWGYELHWAKTDRYVGKLMHVNAGHALSLQYHAQGRDDPPLAGRLLFEIEQTGCSKRIEVRAGERCTSRRRPSTA